MKRLFAAAAVLALATACAVPALASPPYVTSEYYYNEFDGSSRFDYRIQNLGSTAFIDGFHVYAPVDASLLSPAKGSFNSVDWLGTATQLSPGVADIVWRPTSAAGALWSGDSVKVMLWITVPANTREDFVRPGYVTNWGYETGATYSTGENTLLLVPEVVPEPSSLAALAGGLVALLWRRMRR